MKSVYCRQSLRLESTSKDVVWQYDDSRSTEAEAQNIIEQDDEGNLEIARCFVI